MLVRTFRPRANLWIECDGQVALSEWRVRLLEAIAETGSISEATRRQDVDYRTAWRKLKEMEERLGVKLTERTVGGPRGGGTQLTTAGHDYVRKFRKFARGIESVIERQFVGAFGSGRKTNGSSR